LTHFYHLKNNIIAITVGFYAIATLLKAYVTVGCVSFTEFFQAIAVAFIPIRTIYHRGLCKL
jgi:hypothetical protein